MRAEAAAPAASLFSFLPSLAGETMLQKNHLPTHIHIKGSKALPKDSIVLAEQIRTIDRYRLKNYVGSVDLELMEKVEKAMKISIGVDFDD